MRGGESAEPGGCTQPRPCHPRRSAGCGPCCILGSGPPHPLPALDPAVPGCGSASENVSVDAMLKGNSGGSQSSGTLPQSLLFCASQLEAQRVQTPSGGHWSGEHLPHPFLRGPTQTPSSLSQLSLPGHNREGAVSLVQEGKPLPTPWAGAQTGGSGHLGGDSHSVSAFDLVTGTFHDGYSSNVSTVSVVLRLKGKFLWVKFCLANL